MKLKSSNEFDAYTLDIARLTTTPWLSTVSDIQHSRFIYTIDLYADTLQRVNFMFLPFG